MTRAVIYARYSTDRQREASVEDQIRRCRAFIGSKDWTPGEVYSDRAMSGAEVLRPGYQKLLADARAGAFDIVVAEALDRLSRDQEDIAGFYKQLSFNGIQIVTLTEGEINELHVGLKGTMNALFLKDLAEKTRRGLEGRVRAGRSAGGIAYGYRIIREASPNGEPVRGGRTVDEAESTIVRRIFNDFAKGASPRTIAKQLNREGVLGPRGLEWRDTAIRGHATRGTGILNNELYVGRLVWNRLRYVKDPITRKRLSRINPSEDWIVEPVPDLRIVDDALWQKVKSRQQIIAQGPTATKIRQSRFWEHRRPRHLLSGLARCGVCGGGLAPAGKDYLACSAARGRGTCSNTRSIRRPLLEGLVLEPLKSHLMQPDHVAQFITAFNEEVNRQSGNQNAERIMRERELGVVTRRLSGLIDAIADGLRTAGLKQKLEELEARKDELEDLIASSPKTPLRLHPNLADVYRHKVAKLHDAFRNPQNRDEAINSLRDLVEAVIVHPTESGFEIELVGKIAAMVELGHDSKKATLSEEAASSIKVVAGVGFEPTTFRL